MDAYLRAIVTWEKTELTPQALRAAASDQTDRELLESMWNGVRVKSILDTSSSSGMSTLSNRQYRVTLSDGRVFEVAAVPITYEVTLPTGETYNVENAESPVRRALADKGVTVAAAIPEQPTIDERFRKRLAGQLRQVVRGGFLLWMLVIAIPVLVVWAVRFVRDGTFRPGKRTNGPVDR